MKNKVYLALVAAVFVYAPGARLSGQHISPAAGTLPNLHKPATPVGFVMSGGTVYVVKNGVATPLQHEMVLRVTPEGVVGFDQIPRRIPANIMLTYDGYLVTAPTGLTYAPAPVEPPSSNSIAAERRWAGRSVYGQNVSGLAPARGRGPHPVISKKKGGKSSKPRLPTGDFSDETIPLPYRASDIPDVLDPPISAENTMLSMTADSIVEPEPEAGSARELGVLEPGIGLTLNPGDALKAHERGVPDDEPLVPLPPLQTPLPNLPQISPIQSPVLRE